MTEEDTLLDTIRKEWESQFPEAMTAIREYDRILTATLANQQKHRKTTYNLVKVPNKKHGFLYYVRYKDDTGCLLPSKWSTKTQVLEEAERFAVYYREEILAEYYAKRAKKQAPVQRQSSVAGILKTAALSPAPLLLESVELYATLSESYQEHSAYITAAKNRGRTLDKKTRSVYDHFMNKRFIPFLQKQGVTTFSGVTPSVIFNLQEQLLAQGNQACTINRYLGSVKAVFDYLFMKGAIGYNVFDQAKMLRTGGRNAQRIRGCLEIDRMKGVFTRKWGSSDPLHYLLCLMIYSTGMRNSEIERIRVKDIVRIDGYYFINVAKSKSGNGIRKVPLHPFVYKKMMSYAKNLNPESYLFSAKGNHNQSTLYKEANAALGKRLGMSETELKEQGISFYSGRHFWKTLMNSEGLGEDIEEYFMGHTVSGDVAKTYNHKDKQGKSKLLTKVQEVFAILDRTLFKRNIR